ncbi:MAG: hypothetical protein R3C03_20955 [Pirellulaceae bacterium]
MEATLGEGALRLWPNLDLAMSRAMLNALCRVIGVDQSIPFSQLDARKRRSLFYGTGERWIQVPAEEGVSAFSFQFKGLYPALEEASRLSVPIRQRMQALMGDVECGACGGSRLRDDSAAVRFLDQTIDGICRMPLATLHETVAGWELDDRQKKVAGELLREIQNRVEFLNDVGLNYLTLGRGSATLSNGEAQRIRLASQLGSGLVGVLYVLDEPTIGLHPRDNTRLLGALKKLRDLGNTLLVVEHDREVIESADQVYDFGPEAGVNGGLIVASGTMEQLAKKRGSVTGPYLSGKKAIPIPANRRPGLTADDEDTKPKRRSKKKADGPLPQTAVATQTLQILGTAQQSEEHRCGNTVADSDGRDGAKWLRQKQLGERSALQLTCASFAYGINDSRRSPKNQWHRAHQQGDSGRSVTTR